LVVSGHQPELFHPGVWIKNFALAGLAQRYGVTPLNLIVDNDTVKSTSVRLPNRSRRLSVVAFDQWSGETPYEEHRLADPDLFASFADRARAELLVENGEPVLREFWAEVLRPPRRDWLLVERFPAARRRLERAWGCVNLELPVSQLCQTTTFGWFALHLLGELPRFHECHNAAVRDYRRRHRLRSRSHPVPDLAQEGDWWEAPFWGWRTGQSRRGRLFVRSAGRRLELRTGDDIWPTLELSPKAAPELTARLADAGYRLRTRALTTTLFSRLLLADLFLHGIGGGKYDELTDVLFRDFYGINPPGFLILTGTRLLPLSPPPADEADRKRVAHQLRDLWYNPQRHLTPEEAESILPLLRTREDWVARRPATRAERRERFRAIRTCAEQLRPVLAGRRRQLELELQRVDRHLADAAALQRRDFAFCLYPEATLRPFCIDLLDPRRYGSSDAEGGTVD
jgi:hypothetical protein